MAPDPAWEQAPCRIGVIVVPRHAVTHPRGARLHGLAAPAGATILRFPALAADSPALEAKVDAALIAIAARRTSGAGDLFDLISTPLYALVLAITKDDATAQEATVAAFTEIWCTSAHRPDCGATKWVMEVACRCARSAVQVHPATRGLRLVPAP